MVQAKNGTARGNEPVAAAEDAPEVHSVSIDVSHLAVPEEVVREEPPLDALEALEPVALELEPVTPPPDEPLVLGPEHVVHEEIDRPLPKAKLLIDIRVIPDEELDSSPEPDVPVLGPEHEIRDEGIPVLGPEHIVPEDIPVLGPEHEIRDEDIPVLGPEHEIHDPLPIPPLLVLGSDEDDGMPLLRPRSDEDDGMPLLSPRPRVLEDIPVLGPEHEIHDEEVPVLGPEHEVPESSGSVDTAWDEPESPSDEAVLEEDSGIEDEAAVESSQPLEPVATEADSRNYRQIYEARFRDLERDARAAEAHRVDGAELFALCLDPDPQVIAAVFQNSRAGLDHARMVAHHHKNPVGLEHIVKRADFLRDTQTQRQLLRNNQLTESLMRRVLGARIMRDVYKVCLDRDVPERNRAWSRGVLRQKFTNAQAEERADLVISTEARCLALLVGQTFDSRTTQILCSRQYNSTLFIQNLAHFSACPPALLVHLLKQPFVRRHTALRRLLLQHPNMPTQAKRTL